MKAIKIIFRKTGLKPLVCVAIFSFCFLFSNAQSWPPLGMLGDGSQGNPWQIIDSSHLRALADYVNAGNGNNTNGVYYKLMNNIDLNAYTSGAGWMPIGRQVSTSDFTQSFQGNFNGNNCIIENITINRGTVPNSNIGLFGHVIDATIQNVGIESGSIIGYTGTGGLVGYVDGSSRITNSYSRVNIIGNASYTGGLVGRMWTNSIVTNCYATGNVTGNLSNGGSGGISGNGGLVGYNVGTITSCYATGNVITGNTTPNGTGGLIGYNGGGTITDCYATGNVTGSSNNLAYVGGLVGYNDGYFAAIIHCYAIGKVIGREYVGGLVGNNTGTVQNCVSANDSITATTSFTMTINSIIGYNGGTLQNNYAFDSMVIKMGTTIITRTDDGTVNGIGKNRDTLRRFAFYNTTDNWYNNTTWSIDSATAVWKICDGQDLPFLRWQRIICGDIYNIISTTGTNGTINPLGVISVAEETNQPFTFMPNTCYEIDSLWIDGVYAPDSIATGSYTFENVIKNHTIGVSFKKIENITHIADTICSNMPYIFGNQTLTNSGVYYDTLQNINGCDSVIELTLTVNPVYFTQISDSISVGGSYNFYGKQLTESGIYYDTLQTIHGCDSIFELTLKVGSLDINELKVESEKLKVYPNPVNYKLKITNYELKENDVIEIYSVVGQVVMQAPLNPPEGGKLLPSFGGAGGGLIIDVSHLAKGMYFLRIDGKVVKFVKE